jgi:hypothetical protein
MKVPEVCFVQTAYYETVNTLLTEYEDIGTQLD